jgi:signal transduction histidine kinase
MKSDYKILIIDDEEIVLESCTEILSSDEYEINTASNGEMGLELLKEITPDIVFVDLKMPGISGIDVLEKIHSLDPSIVTVVITGYATVDSAVEAMKHNAYDFLPKPFTPDELRLLTKRGLERRKLILETRALRREKELLRENFAAIVSHELKSPLGAVQQNLYFLLDELTDKLNDEQKDRFQRIKTRISDLLGLVNTWLRVYSTDLDSISKQFKPVDISEIVTKAVESVEPHAIRKDVDIDVNIQDTSIRVFGDQGTLSEAVINILNNAVKYSHGGSNVVLNLSKHNDNVLIKITDFGVGISQEDMPLIFDSFYSGKTDSSIEKGVGIGLSISKRIIEIHDGTLSVESESGKGSTFSIHLPEMENHPDSLKQSSTVTNTI